MRLQSHPELPWVNNMKEKNGGPTDRRTDRRTDTPSYRDARTHLKMKNEKVAWGRIVGLLALLFSSSQSPSPSSSSSSSSSSLRQDRDRQSVLSFVTIFRCVLASLLLGLSVRPSVHRWRFREKQLKIKILSILQSVGPSLTILWNFVKIGPKPLRDPVYHLPVDGIPWTTFANIKSPSFM